MRHAVRIQADGALPGRSRIPPDPCGPDSEILQCPERRISQRVLPDSGQKTALCPQAGGVSGKIQRCPADHLLFRVDIPNNLSNRQNPFFHLIAPVV